MTKFTLQPINIGDETISSAALLQILEILKERPSFMAKDLQAIFRERGHRDCYRQAESLLRRLKNCGAIERVGTSKRWQWVKQP